MVLLITESGERKNSCLRPGKSFPKNWQNALSVLGHCSLIFGAHPMTGTQAGTFGNIYHRHGTENEFLSPSGMIFPCPPTGTGTSPGLRRGTDSLMDYRDGAETELAQPTGTEANCGCHCP